MIAIYIIVGIVIVLLLGFIIIYNRLVNMRNQMKNAWARLDVQLKRRHDLIPNLVEAVKGYKQYEKGILEALTKARSAAQSASGAGIAERAKAEGELGGFLSRLLAVVENYPELKANENFMALQQELTMTENKISSARQDYNDMVMQCNNLYQVFPSNIVAGIFGYKSEAFFEVKETEERATPEIGF